MAICPVQGGNAEPAAPAGQRGAEQVPQKAKERPETPHDGLPALYPRALWPPAPGGGADARQGLFAPALGAVEEPGAQREANVPGQGQGGEGEARERDRAGQRRRPAQHEARGPSYRSVELSQLI